MVEALWMVLGALLGAALVRFADTRAPAAVHRVYAVALVVAAAVYPAFALLGGSTRWLWVELGGLAAFAAVALAGLDGRRWLLAVGWILHVAWDVGLHGPGTFFVPELYPTLCVGFDLVVAGALLRRP